MAEGGRNLRIKPFTVEDHIATGEKWDDWLEELEWEMRFFRISDAADKKDAMLIYGGREIQRLEKSLQDPEEGDVYAKLQSKLNNYFAPKKNIHYARYLFLKMKPHTGESTVSYAARLREKSKSCDFHDDDERILEYIIQTTDNTDLVRKVLNRKWTLKETLAEMQVLEDTSEQVEAMGRQEESNNISKIGKRKKEKNKSLNEALPKETNKTCKYCGKTHLMQKELCPAYGKFCSKCGKPNHFFTVCMSSKETRRQRWNQSSDRRRDVKRATNESEADESGSDEDRDTHFIDETVMHLTAEKIKVNKVSDFEKTVPIVINDVIVHMELDSGADVNVMDEYHYKALKRKSYENIALYDSSTRLSTLHREYTPHGDRRLREMMMMMMNELHVSGEFKATARNETRGTDTTFVVI